MTFLFERNLKIVIALVNGDKIKDVAKSVNLTSPRAEAITKTVLQRIIKDDHVKYLTAKQAVEEYREQLKNHELIREHFAS